MKVNFYNLKQVCEITTLKRSTLYEYMKQEIFPKPVKFGERKVMWRKEDIDQWLEDKGVTKTYHDFDEKSFEQGFTAGCHHVLESIKNHKHEIGECVFNYIINIVQGSDEDEM